MLPAALPAAWLLASGLLATGPGLASGQVPGWRAATAALAADSAASVLATDSAASALVADSAAASLAVDTVGSDSQEEPKRPPGDHPWDPYDVLSLPLRVAAFPLALVGYGAREALRLAFPADGPSGGRGSGMRVAVALSDVEEWGLGLAAPSLGPRGGPALALRLERFAPLFAETALSWRMYRRHAVGLEGRHEGDRAWGRHEGDRVWGRVAAAFHVQREPHFWGVGAGTLPEARADFRWEQWEVAAEARRGPDPLGARSPAAGGEAGPEPPYGLSATLGVALEGNRTSGGADDAVTDLADAVDPADLFGLAESTRFLRTSAGARLDGLRWRALQPHGGEVAAEAQLFRGIGSTEADFLRLRIRTAFHLPLNPYQGVALLARGESHQALGGRGAPFTHLASLGGDVGARAYEGGRFRDRALAAAAAEWRYELWRTIHDDARVEAFLFAEAGTVGRAPGALSVGALKSSWGLGFRGVDRAGLRALGFLAFGAEGARFGGAVSWPH